MLSRCSGCRELLRCRTLLSPLVQGAVDDIHAGLAFAGSHVRATTSVSHKGRWTNLMSSLRFQELPKRLVFLNGAPGSGKTKALDTVKAFSGIQHAYSMSTVISLHRQINSQTLKSMRGLAGDDIACSALLSSMRSAPMGTRELVIDGFPRSESQVDFLEELVYHVKTVRTEQGSPRPQLDACMVVLHVDEATSVERQMARQVQAEEYNAAVRDSRQGTLMEERVTDKCEGMCRGRYQVFAESQPALRRVESFMSVYHIDASNPVDTCSHDIASALLHHRSLQSQPPAEHGNDPVPGWATPPEPEEAVSPWALAWSWMTGSAKAPSHGAGHGIRMRTCSGWPPQGVIWC